jgi:pimeloyl-ACP methyl ester carboxylesterase
MESRFYSCFFLLLSFCLFRFRPTSVQLIYICHSVRTSQFESVKKAKNLTLPCLFMSGEADTLVPPSMVENLHHACGSTEKQLVTFPRGGHNDTWMCAGYYDAILKFMVKVRRTSRNFERVCKLSLYMNCCTDSKV